ncbi:hypothetical protein JL721_8276 [Aureococcus anophagefferens]|nr:hypothetical protein JL721_8276 [Aureococcus anophagefferens]
MGAAKLHEWVASPAVVTCVALGPRSHQVLASGGEDKRANVWRLRPGDPGAQNVWSLGGNSSPISCLCFDDAENTLVSGAQGGSVRLYDLTEGRCSRALNGHRNEVLCCHTHPFGDFLASGGADEAVRVWDARKKSCIQTYKGHGGEVDSLKFSPDGRWIASASRRDGLVRLWDLTAGKLLRSFAANEKSGTCRATRLEFSPFEFVLAAACSDRRARLFDLETWSELACTPPETANAKALCFSRSGKSVVCATDHGAKQWAWDAPKLRCLESEDRGAWDGLQLVRAASHRAVAACCAMNFVSVWSVAPGAKPTNAAPPANAAAPKRDEAAFVANATRADVAGPVDIAREDRVRRCHDAKRLFASVRRKLPGLRGKFASSRKVDDLAQKLGEKHDALF